MKTTTKKWTLMTMALTGILFSSSPLLSSCKKEKSDTSGCSKSLTGLAGAYKLTALQYQSSATAAPADYLAYMDDCEKDDILILKDDGTYSSNDAGTACTPEETSQGTWQVKGNTLISDGKLNGTIASYDCKTLVYYTENAITPGDKLTFTMVKQ